jgi:protein-tyrosine phosphatase
LHELHRFAKTPEHKAKIHLITTFSDLYQGEEVPDPYYGGDAGFARVLDMLEDSCSGLIKYLKSKNLGMSGQ